MTLKEIREYRNDVVGRVSAGQLYSLISMLLKYLEEREQEQDTEKFNCCLTSNASVSDGHEYVIDKVYRSAYGDEEACEDEDKEEIGSDDIVLFSDRKLYAINFAEAIEILYAGGTVAYYEDDIYKYRTGKHAVVTIRNFIDYKWYKIVMNKKLDTGSDIDDAWEDEE
jgi:hypothetical protein